ncbi:MAG: hypothetical protein M1819_004140 [Sarea resinae]|nr:MAG: hypothetical protein M1819_004140 [Sarea resinae]
MADLKPPFDPATAHRKVKAAQVLWNTRDPARIAAAYTPDCVWRNRSTFLQGHAEIIDFLTRKFAREQGYRLQKKLFAADGAKIAVEFWYEFMDAEDGGVWKRCYGIEHWTFDERGKMERRVMSGNDLPVAGGEPGRWFTDEKGGVEAEVEVGDWQGL